MAYLTRTLGPPRTSCISCSTICGSVHNCLRDLDPRQRELQRVTDSPFVAHWGETREVCRKWKPFQVQGIDQYRLWGGRTLSPRLSAPSLGNSVLQLAVFRIRSKVHMEWLRIATSGMYRSPLPQRTGHTERLFLNVQYIRCFPASHSPYITREKS
jgi:hypothetical protein